MESSTGAASGCNRVGTADVPEPELHSGVIRAGSSAAGWG